MVFGTPDKAARGEMIYQYNRKLKIVGFHRTLMAASDALGIPERTISAATLKGSLCRGEWYFSRGMNFSPPVRTKGEKKGMKFAVLVTEDVWSRMLSVIGQRNKQDIFRHLLSEWLENEERKHDAKSN